MDASQPGGGNERPHLGRRTFIIDRAFQLKYTLLLSLMSAFISVLFGTMMYLVHLDAQRTLHLIGPLQAELISRDETLIWLMAGSTVLMAMALALFGILVTHRVAGPVYVMSHYMSVLARGRYPMMRPLRKNDELKAFFEQFQGAIEALRQREVDEADKIQQAIARFEASASSGEQKDALAALKIILERKRDATDQVVARA